MVRPAENPDNYRVEPHGDVVGFVVERRVGRYDWARVTPREVHPTRAAAETWITKKIADLKLARPWPVSWPI